MHLAVGLLDDGKHLERFAEHGQFLGMDGQLAGLGNEGKTLDAHDVADVEEFLEYGIVHRLVFAGTDFVAFDIDLDTAALVLEFHEGSGAHDAAGHDAARDADVVEIAFFRVKTRQDILCGGIDGVQGCRIRLDAQFPELVHGVAPLEFLLAELNIRHNRNDNL